MISMISVIALAAMLAAAEPPPYPVTVWLGVDCSAGAAPFTTSLADDVEIGECAPKRD